MGTYRRHWGCSFYARESEPDFGPPLPILSYKYEFLARFGVFFVCYFKRVIVLLVIFGFRVHARTSW